MREFIKIVESGILAEAKVMRLPQDRGTEFTVWQNPTAAEIRNLVRNFRNIRGISTPQAVYVWSADEALHWMVEEAMERNAVELLSPITFILGDAEHGLGDFDHWERPEHESNGLVYQTNMAGIGKHAPFKRMMRGNIVVENASTLRTESSWIKADGTIIQSPTPENIWHPEEARKHFPNSSDPLGAALQSGWVRTNASGHYLNLQFNFFRATPAALLETAKLVRSVDLDMITYVIEGDTGQGDHSFTSQRSVIRFLNSKARRG